MRRPALSLLLLATAWSAPVLAEQPLALIQETRVEARLLLTLTRPGQPVQEFTDELRGLAGETMPLVRSLPLGEHELQLGVVLRARPDEDAPEARVELEWDVRAGAEPPQSASRRFSAVADRLLLVDLWSDDESGARLVLGLTLSWKQVPLLVPRTPGAEPVDLVISALAQREGRLRLLERHRLSSLVGTPVEYTYRREPLPGSGQTPAVLIVTVLPRELRDGALSLRASVRHSEGGGGASARGDGSEATMEVTETVPPGVSVDLPLPGKQGQPPLVFRVTPYF